MAAEDTPETTLVVATLSAAAPRRFDLRPDPEARAALARQLGAETIRKLRFEGDLRAIDGGWLLRADLGATVVQPCAVTLAPVTTRIDVPVTRRFVPADRLEPEPGTETEIPEDDTLEPLGARIDLVAVMAEALALAMPTYPRAEGADLPEAVFGPDGVTPLRDEDTKPFAGLAGLRDRLGKDD